MAGTQWSVATVFVVVLQGTSANDLPGALLTKCSKKQTYRNHRAANVQTFVVCHILA